MNRVPREKHALFAIPLGQQQIMPPGHDVENFEIARKSDQVLNDGHEIRIRRQHRVQREFRAATLGDHAGPAGVGELVMAAFAGDDFFVERVRFENHLHQLAQSAFTFQFNAQFLAGETAAAVASHQIGALETFVLARDGPGARRHAVRVLFEIRQFQTVADRDVRGGFRDLFQQRFQFVLGHELVRFQQPVSVRRFRDLFPPLRHRRIFQSRDRFVAEPCCQKHVHWVVGGIAQGADAIDDSDAPVEFHGPGVGAVHFRPWRRRGVFFHDQAADASPSQIDRQGQADGTRARDDDIVCHGQTGGAIRKAFDELKIQVSTNPVSFGLRSRAFSAPVRHIQFRISCWPASSTSFAG